MNLSFKFFFVLTRPVIWLRLNKIKFISKTGRKIYNRLFEANKADIVVGNAFKIGKYIRSNHISNVTETLMLKNSYEFSTTNLFINILEKGDTVIDVGANIGYYSLLSSYLVGEEGKVYAFEPDPDNIEALLNNCKINNFNNIVPLQKAMSNFKGKTNLYTTFANDPQTTEGWHSLVKPDTDLLVLEVEVDTLDNLIPKQAGKIKLIKTDTEGNDLAVLQGAIRLIKNNPDINLIVECYPAGLLNANSSVKDLLDFIKELQFAVYVISDKENRLIKCIDESLIINMCSKLLISVNLFCCRNNFKFEKYKIV